MPTLRKTLLCASQGVIFQRWGAWAARSNYITTRAVPPLQRQRMLRRCMYRLSKHAQVRRAHGQVNAEGASM